MYGVCHERLQAAFATSRRSARQVHQEAIFSIVKTKADRYSKGFSKKSTGVTLFDDSIFGASIFDDATFEVQS